MNSTEQLFLRLIVYSIFLYLADCKFNCHKRCESEVPDNCPGEDSNCVFIPGEDANTGKTGKA